MASIKPFRMLGSKDVRQRSVECMSMNNVCSFTGNLPLDGHPARILRLYHTGLSPCHASDEASPFSVMLPASVLSTTRPALPSNTKGPALFVGVIGPSCAK